MLLALDAASWANIAVAAGTALLALATFVLAARAKAQADATNEQADATAELVEIARQELAATAVPNIVPAGGIGEATGVRGSADTVVATLRNIGVVRAEYEKSTLTLSYESDAGGGARTYVMEGALLRDERVIKPNENFRVEFKNKEKLPSVGSGSLRVQYRGPGSGTHKLADIGVTWQDPQLSVHKVTPRDLVGD